MALNSTSKHSGIAEQGDSIILGVPPRSHMSGTPSQPRLRPASGQGGPFLLPLDGDCPPDSQALQGNLGAGVRQYLLTMCA